MNALTLWEYSALLYEWAERQPENETLKPPTAEDLEAMRQDLMALGDPNIRL